MEYTALGHTDIQVSRLCVGCMNLVRMGKVRALGASAMYAHQFAAMQDVAQEHGWAAFQAMENHYNLLNWEDERELMPICAAQGVSLILYSPLAETACLEEMYLPHPIADAIDRNPPEGVVLLNEKK